MTTTSVMIVVVVVCGYSVIQSLFGVGLLVFGTPTLLLAGFSFDEVLAYLLPCSIAVSFLQVREDGFTIEPIRRKFLLYATPAVLSGTLIVLLVLNHKVNLRPLVGAMLILTAGMRLVGPLRDRLARFVKTRLSTLLMAMGLLHGLSNLGGGLLTAIVGSIYTDKRTARKHVAFCYGVMALIQLTVLVAATDRGWDWKLQLALPLLAGVTYSVVGRKVFDATRHAVYQWGLTTMIGLFGLILLTT
jgi:hypothetical protein